MKEDTLYLGVPSEKQKQFLTATERYVAYGGARGGGKSWAVRVKALLLAFGCAGAKILILRRTLPELQQNHIRPLCELLSGKARYNDEKKCFFFPNSSQILLGYCRSEKDLLRYQGQEYDFIFIDEATQMEEYVFERLKGCLRGVGDIPKRMYLTCNPGGVGHAWVKRLFIDRRFEKNEDPADYRFIPAKLSDNDVLRRRDPEYVKSLQTLPTALRRAWLDGEWDVFSGQYFEEFSREKHTVAPFEIPGSWRRYLAFDYGLDMLAALWFAVSPDGYIYVYRELHEKDLIVSRAAEKLRELSGGERLEEIYLPPDMASRQKDSGLTMEELFYRGGIYGRPADNRRVPGWLAVKEMLRPTPDLSGGSTPRLRIFTTCTTLITNLPALLHDEKDPSDASVYPHEITHICDALRYFALSCTQRPQKSRAVDPLLAERLRRLSRARRSTF